jgi:WD40 repeat protein
MILRTLIAVVTLLLGIFSGLAQNQDADIRQLALSNDATLQDGRLAVVVDDTAYVFQLDNLAADPLKVPLTSDYALVSLTPDGSHLLTMGDCNDLEVIDLESKSLVSIVMIDDPYCGGYTATFSHDGTFAYIENGTLYTVASLFEQGSIHLDTDAFSMLDRSVNGLVAFSPDDTRMVYVHGNSNNVYISDVETGERIAALESVHWVRSNTNYDHFVFSSDGAYVAAIPGRGPIIVFDAETGALVWDAWQDTEIVGIAAWLDDSNGTMRAVYRGSQRDGVNPTHWRIFDSFDQTIDDVSPLLLETENASFGTFSQDGSLLVLVTDENRIALHDGTNGDLVRTLTLTEN